MTLFIGTYTSSTSEGIYTYRMNSDTGELTKFTSIKSENPSFLTLDRSKRFLYAVNELKRILVLFAVTFVKRLVAVVKMLIKRPNCIYLFLLMYGY